MPHPVWIQPVNILDWLNLLFVVHRCVSGEWDDCVHTWGGWGDKRDRCEAEVHLPVDGSHLAVSSDCCLELPAPGWWEWRVGEFLGNAVYEQEDMYSIEAVVVYQLRNWVCNRLHCTVQLFGCIPYFQTCSQYCVLSLHSPGVLLPRGGIPCITWSLQGSGGVGGWHCRGWCVHPAAQREVHLQRNLQLPGEEPSWCAWLGRRAAS